jgi:hypothetical protein
MSGGGGCGTCSCTTNNSSSVRKNIVLTAEKEKSNFLHLWVKKDSKMTGKGNDHDYYRAVFSFRFTFSTNFPRQPNKKNSKN